MSRRAAVVVASLWIAAAGCASAQRPRTGRPAFVPALALESVGPVKTTVDALHGRVVLVSFMATWCFPCLQELPDFVALQKRFGASGFTVVLVGMDLEGATVLAPFADYYALPFPLLIADEAIRTGESPFGSITQLPTSVLLGKDGAPVAAYLGVANLPELTAQIDRALAR